MGSKLRNVKIRWKLLAVVLPLVLGPMGLAAAAVGYLAKELAVEGLARTSRDDLDHMAEFALDLLAAHHRQFEAYRQDKKRVLQAELTSVLDLALRLVEAQIRREADGAVNLPEAQAEARKALKAVSVGDTGYVYAMTSAGVLTVHVAREGEDISGSRDENGRYFIREMCARAAAEPGKVQFIVYPWRNPARGEAAARRTEENRRQIPSARSRGDFRPGEMLRTPTFYTLWTLYLIGSGAGLMVIGSVAGMAKASLGSLAFVAVALLAVGNAAGRVVAGVLSDRIGRTKTLIGMFLFQAALMFAAVPVVGGGSQSAALLVAMATFIGFNYGANLSLFPSFAKDFWGLKHFGTNYGILFTAWGVGGFVMGRVSQMLRASTGNYNLSFLAAGTLLLAGVGLALTLREGKRYQTERAIEEEAASAAATEVRPGASTGTA